MLNNKITTWTNARIQSVCKVIDDATNCVAFVVCGTQLTQFCHIVECGKQLEQ